MRKLLVTLTAITLLSACNNQTAKIDQSKLCHVQTDAQAKACPTGELMFFQPSSFGNEQLPVMIAAAYCDSNYQIMHTSGAVMCVFTDKRLTLVN